MLLHAIDSCGCFSGRSSRRRLGLTSIAHVFVIGCIALECTRAVAEENATVALAADKLNLFVWDADGEKVKMLDRAVLPDMDWNGSPEWSHDGTRIAFDATPKKGEWQASHIAVYHVTGPNQGTTEDLGLGDGPTWSADNSRIAFFLNGGTGGGAPGTWMMNADGTDRKWLCDAWQPNWSPDGKYIICTDGFGSERHLILYEVATGKIRPFTTTLAVQGQPAWSPDSKKLAVPILVEKGNWLVILDLENGEDIQQLIWHEMNAPGTEKRLIASNVCWGSHPNDLLVTMPSADPNECPMCLLGLGRMTRLKSDWKGSYRNPAWTDDGKRIVFCSNPPVK